MAKLKRVKNLKCPALETIGLTIEDLERQYTVSDECIQSEILLDQPWCLFCLRS
jgi:hypothetical protein